MTKELKLKILFILQKFIGLLDIVYVGTDKAICVGINPTRTVDVRP